MHFYICPLFFAFPRHPHPHPNPNPQHESHYEIQRTQANADMSGSQGTAGMYRMEMEMGEG